MERQKGIFYPPAISMVIIWTIMLCLSCANNPATKKREFVLMTEEQEIRVEREMTPRIFKEYGAYTSDNLQQYIPYIV